MNNPSWSHLGRQQWAEMRAMADAVERRSPQFPDDAFNARNLARLLRMAVDDLERAVVPEEAPR